ncbi:MAG: tRNA (adenosine(37)-N6)-dimethylallyltransferase MiaA [Deltaproteobacteria bacterium CG03_land_8_20_14_0_80_45_14]|nr:MAG: tRNA (adenosine(37)-N6)-dimethylallyltransferase MiaA [Deltaproteobacteria bacterium CG03_land_8_20_14_0_80_45_14]
MAATIEMNRPRVVIVLGPTGVGKSKLAIEWAEELGGEIISADSMQVYRYMDIGTAKPTLDDQKRVQHHLIDLVPPDQPFHAALYRTLGRKTIDQLYENKTPIWVVGGTGLYIKTLIQGLFASPKIDPQVRESLKQEAKEKGADALYERLKKVDPKTAFHLHPNDLFRIIRALEVFDSTGAPISFYREQHRFGEKPYLTLKVGLEINRDRLYRRIEERVDQMLEKGFLQEVERLMEMGYGPALKPMQSLGYKQMVQFLLKEIGWDEAVRQMKRDTRHYAKRQLTWFKADSEIHWWDESIDREEIFLEIKSFWRRGGERA